MIPPVVTYSWVVGTNAREITGSYAERAAIHQLDGGSLAGNDCRPHSSTISSMLGLARFGSPVRGLVIPSLGDVARDEDRACFSPAVLPLTISISANASPTLTG
jgi:hypothetical protein